MANDDTTFDPLYLPHPSRRLPLYAREGMICSTSPLASAAGLEAIRRGGNAIDAVVAAASTLTAVEPTSNGIGSDAFALVWSAADHRLYGLNSSGPAPRGISRDLVLSSGKAIMASAGRSGSSCADDQPDTTPRMPARGWTPVTVPGAPAAWASLTKRFGRKSLAENLAQAVRYARQGYAISPNTAHQWQLALNRLSDTCQGAEFEEFWRVFAPLGHGPASGSIVTLPDLADTLEEIGNTESRSFYDGDLARRIDEDSQAHGGYLRLDDLASFEPEWVNPISVDYRGFEVCEIPPNGQGIATLMALNVLRNFDIPGTMSHDCPDQDQCTGHAHTSRHAASYLPMLPLGQNDASPDLIAHLQIEAMKLGFADAFAHVTDPRHMRIDPYALISPSHGASQAARITAKAGSYGPTDVGASGTVYLCAADGEGNMVSYIQSNYQGFGSGIVVRGTGISLQNRGADFSLDAHSINRLEPGKRTYHTIIPGFLMRDGEPVGPFGVMGAYMQPQGHLQVVSNFVDFGLNPQQCLDAPRWQWLRDGTVIVEESFDAAIAEGLRRRGHAVNVSPDMALFGRGQMIVRLGSGVLVGGCEPRADSSIACF